MPQAHTIDLPRVDHIGSLLRPRTLQEAFARHAAGEISEAQLSDAQDAAIRDVLDQQERLDLPVVTDGEFRRRVFMNSFAEVAGWDLWSRRQPAPGARPTPAAASATLTHTDPTRTLKYAVTERLRLVRNAPLGEYQFSRGLTSKPVKVTVIDTDRIRSVVDPDASREAYPDPHELLADVVAIEHEIVRGLAEAGCGYIQIDGPSYTRFVDPDWTEQMRIEGQDPASALHESIQADNAVISSIDGVTFAMHLCRGNPADGGYHRQGYYDPIAEPLFNELKHDRFLLEYDTERAGSFEPLRFVPRDKTVVLGLVSTKVPEAESVDELKRRIDEAAQFIPLEQLAISPQCGFSSGLGGYRLTQEQQWRKLEVLMETARQVWGA
jgi:5-methyltetrahydropteroyltriglutamate--homocysteine methyltransferase